MKTRSFKTGNTVCRSYMKPVGKGWEIGFSFGPKPVFVGNFVHSGEANKWWGLMNKEIRTFSKKFKVGKSYPSGFFKSFISHHLYGKYYDYVNKLAAKHARSFHTARRKDTTKYKRLTKKWPPREKKPLFKAA